VGVHTASAGEDWDALGSAAADAARERAIASAARDKAARQA
jgi:hypothetical protein